VVALHSENACSEIRVSTCKGGVNYLPVDVCPHVVCCISM